jgi:eukaryotic-like serine/threonine-protein kinase
LAVDPAVAQRFKQELLLASKISHKNILRIHDLGEAGGVKFISMAFVEGEDLHQLLTRHGKLPVDRALKIAKQLCSALDAAHNEGVVHRDFKPQNILLDKNESVYVSDFGLAKSLEHDTGMTKSGEFLGTPRYMAPEQVQGGKIDHRADLYALGLILYEMVTGDVPFHADTTLQLMYKRVHEVPKSPKTLNPDLPDWLVRVIMKCIERDPEKRYQAAGEILHDLETGTGPKSRSGSVQIALPSLGFELNRIWLVIAAAVLLAVGLLAIPSVRQRIFGGGRSTGPHQPVTVLVADFTNHTGDPVFDGTLEPMFNVALEGAGFINAFNRGDALRVAAKLPNPSKRLDDQTARLVAANQGVGVVVSGTLEREGSGYQFLVKAVRAVTGKTVADAHVSAPNKEQVLFVATKAAAAIRRALGDTTSEADQLFATETLTATSLEAVHEYSLGMQASTRGKYAEALQNFSRSVDLDRSFGLAYVGKAVAARNLGQNDEAITDIKEAMQHIDRMTERERYRTRALFYLITHNYQKCVQEYGALLDRYADIVAHNNLGYCWSYLRNMSKAMQEMRQSSEMLPKRVVNRANYALYLAFSGDFPTAEREARTALEMDPSYQNGHFILALAQLGQDNLKGAADSYHKLEQISDTGASIAAAALADVAAYEGRFAESAKILEDAAAADLKAKRLDRAADKFAALAYTNLWRDRKDLAQTAAEKALANDKSVKIRFIAGVVFSQTGATAKAREMAKALALELQAEPQAYAKLVEGQIAMKSGNAREAIKAFSDANGLLDTWIGHFFLGGAYLVAGAFPEADSEFESCIRRRGEALTVYMDDVPTYAYFPLVYYYQGRVREGMKTSNFAESYRRYLSVREKADEDPLLPEVRHRVQQ